MKTRFWLVLAVLGLLVGAPQARAQLFNDAGGRPGATLLLPYFEVNLVDGSQNVIASITNASATAILGHVTVWSDLSVPVLAFNVYLTGFDTVRLDLFKIFAGQLPITASAGQDPANTISPKGPFSQDINFASCGGQFPFPGQLGSNVVKHVRNSLTGKPTDFYGGRCAGRALGDRIARGYVTVDTVNNCTLQFAGDPGYFVSGGFGSATNQNVLFGDYAVRDADGEFGASLVSIQANPLDPETSTPGEYTFYGRYVAWTAADNRAPLATYYVSRFFRGVGPFRGSTTLHYWRDPKVNQQPFVCTNTIPWYPLGQEQIVVFDETEQPEIVLPPPVAPQPPGPTLVPFGAAAGKAQLGGPEFPTSVSRGFVFLNLNQLNAVAGPNPPEDPLASQAYVVETNRSAGLYVAGHPAAALLSGKATTHSFIPVP